MSPPSSGSTDQLGDAAEHVLAVLLQVVRTAPRSGRHQSLVLRRLRDPHRLRDRLRDPHRLRDRLRDPHRLRDQLRDRLRTHTGSGTDPSSGTDPISGTAAAAFPGRRPGRARP
ncbi:hypothetical protein DUI87_00185 [Hirundo rustica rustica]|uniref:Uncharacterized protein n=1 Tax=Hirundo rustica rustica TaxID=333673 RepID=A0A3M0LFM0_HIRRU|nr:hypothetical protein DUI87_00185 [Hirundo rustica rustica]